MEHFYLGFAVATVLALGVEMFFHRRWVRSELGKVKTFSVHEVKVLSDYAGAAKCDYCDHLVAKFRTSHVDPSKVACMNCQQEKGV